MKNWLSDKVRLHRILEAIIEIEQYVRGISFDDFIKDSKTRFATIKQLEIIGEAGHINPDFLNKFEEIEWRAIKSFRNVMVHEIF